MEKQSFAFYISILRKDFVRFCSIELQNLDLTYNQLFILLFINKKEKVTQIEICKFLKLDKSQLNRTLNKLIEKKFIISLKSETDKRKTIIQLTTLGKEIVAKSKKMFHDWDNEILNDLNKEDQKELMNLMEKLVKKISEENK